MLLEPIMDGIMTVSTACYEDGGNSKVSAQADYRD